MFLSLSYDKRERVVKKKEKKCKDNHIMTIKKYELGVNGLSWIKEFNGGGCVI
jgi:hypothetical protein